MYNFPKTVLPSIDRLKVSQTFYDREKEKISITVFSESGMKREQLTPAFNVVRYLWPYRRCREHTFEASLFLADCPKRLPPNGAVLTEDHVNTGYSYPCQTMVVFRKQEWFKVFTHETIHYLGIDGELDRAIKLDFFTIPIRISLAETYTEMWARLIQCKFLGKNKRERDVLLEREKVFSLKNMVRVLRHSNLRYADLFSVKGAAYREETNVFAYVVLTAILFEDADAFLDKFYDFQVSTGELVALIKALCKSPSFLRRVDAEEKKVSVYGFFRLSANELILV